MPTGVGEPRRCRRTASPVRRRALVSRWEARPVHRRAGGRPVRSYVQDARGGPPRRSRRKASGGSRFPRTPSRSRRSAAPPSISIWSDTGVLHSTSGFAADDRPVAFCADGRSLWLFRRGEVPAQVFSSTSPPASGGRGRSSFHPTPPASTRSSTSRSRRRQVVLLQLHATALAALPGPRIEVTRRGDVVERIRAAVQSRVSR